MEYYLLNGTVIVGLDNCAMKQQDAAHDKLSLGMYSIFKCAHVVGWLWERIRTPSRRVLGNQVLAGSFKNSQFLGDGKTFLLYIFVLKKGKKKKKKKHRQYSSNSLMDRKEPGKSCLYSET